MCDFTETEKQCLTATRSLTRDEEGREVLVGLTDEESATLMAHRRRFSAGNRLPDTATLSSWLELAERHGLAQTLLHPEASSDCYRAGRPRPRLG
jgi:hypothetical protein